MRMHIGEKVALARKWASPALTQQDLAVQLGLNRATLARRESEGRFEHPMVRRIAQITGIPEEWFFDSTDVPPPAGHPTHIPLLGSEVGGVANIKVSPVIHIPVVGRASAGPGLEGVDEVPTEFMTISVSLTKGDCVAFYAEGDSMMPFIHPGDKVVVSRTNQPKPGVTFLVRRASGEYSLKQVKWDAGANQWMWFSLNPSFPPEPAHGEIVGMVVTIWREEGSRILTMFDPGGLRPDP